MNKIDRLSVNKSVYLFLTVILCLILRTNDTVVENTHQSRGQCSKKMLKKQNCIATEVDQTWGVPHLSKVYCSVLN